MADGPGPSSQYHSLLSQALVEQFSQPSTQSFAVRHPFTSPQLGVDNGPAPSLQYDLLQTSFVPALTEPKRKPGRPKGSINRKRSLDEEGSHWDHSPVVNKRRHLSPVSVLSSVMEQTPTDGHFNAHPSEPTMDGQISDQDAVKRFYEFQWRALSLCSDFYSAAAELVRSTPAIVLAQSLQLSNRVDPLKVLAEAQRTCDILLTTPSSLSDGPLPPPYTSILVADQQNTPPITTQVAPIPQLVHMHSSVLPIQTPPYSPAQPTTSPSHTQFNVSGQSQLGMSTHALLPPTKTSTRTTFNIRQPTQASHGVWKEDEIAKLQALAEKSKSRTENGEIDWDWVIETFGETRTRHQILIKATGLNLKPTSTHPSRARKRRDTIDALSATVPLTEPGPNPIPSVPMVPSPPMPSPVMATSVPSPLYHTNHPMAMLPNRSAFSQNVQHRALPAVPTSPFSFSHPPQPSLDHQHQQSHHSSTLAPSIPNHYSPQQQSPHIQHPALQQRPQAPNLSPQPASPLLHTYSPMHHHPGLPADYLYSPSQYPVTQLTSNTNEVNPTRSYSMGPYMSNGSFHLDGSSG